MAGIGKATITVTIANPCGLLALGRAIQLADEVCESAPWNEEARELREQLAIVWDDVLFEVGRKP